MQKHPRNVALGDPGPRRAHALRSVLGGGAGQRRYPRFSGFSPGHPCGALRVSRERRGVRCNFCERLRARGLSYWADPMHSRPFEINHNDGGRGVYWNDSEWSLSRDHHASVRQSAIRPNETPIDLVLRRLGVRPRYACPRPGQAEAGTTRANHSATGHRRPPGSHGGGPREEGASSWPLSPTARWRFWILMQGKSIGASIPGIKDAQDALFSRGRFQ